ncbi:MAG: oligosaccharide flippase family protein [Clostridia bacterium]|nr:oligosaccharide flippase family protein [Clostridia bacterium]
MKRIKTLLINTVILTGISLLMRTIGMSFSVYLSRTLGSAAIGLYELIMSVYALAVAFASSGVRLSTTRLIVDCSSREQASQKRIMRVCMTYSLLLGSAAGCALFGGAGLIARRWLQEPASTFALRLLSISLPFLSASSCLNGYFIAVRKAGRFSGTQLLEQLIRIGITLYGLKLLLPRGREYATVALVAGSCCAEALSTLISYAIYRREIRSAGGSDVPPRLLRKLLSIAVPDAVGSWVRSSLVTAKQLLIPRGLRMTGSSSEGALSIYGTIQGMVLPVITFPSALLGAISSLLVPEVAEARALGQQTRIKYMVSRVMHMTLIFSIGTAAALFCFSSELGQAIYKNAQVSLYIRLLAPVIPIMYLDMCVDGVLKGLGLQLSSMKYNIIDAAVSLSLVWFLIPALGIWGYIATIFVSEVLNFVLSVNKLLSVSEVRMSVVKSALKPLLSAAVAAYLAITLHRFCGALIPSMLFFFAAYALMLFALRCMTSADLRWFRGIFR